MATELEQVAEEAKRNNDVATAIFAITLEQLRADFKEINNKLDTLGGKYVSVSDYDNLKERVKDLERARNAFIAFILAAVGTGLVGLVIK